MKLAEAQRLAKKQDQEERTFDSSWNTRWKSLLLTVGAISLPFCGAWAAFFAERVAPHTAPATFLITWGGIVGGMMILGPIWRGRLRRQMGLHSVHARVLRGCTGLENIPTAAAEPLEQCLDAFLHVSRTAEDPVWKGSGVDIARSVEKAGIQLLALLDWGKRLGEVRKTVDRFTGPEGAQVQAQYAEQLARLQAAATAFQDVDAKVARAYVALSGAAPGQTVAPEALAELGAGFDALAEVLGADSGPLPLKLPNTEEPAATLRAGRVS